MKVTPLKKPIVVEFDSVERAMLWLGYQESVRPGYFGKERADSIVNAIHDKLTGGLAVSSQIRKGLERNGINIATWRPALQILIGSYKVEFKPGHINVGCKSVTNELVREILNRLEGKPSIRTRAVVDVHGDKELAALVIEAAKRNGWTSYVSPYTPDKALILGGWHDSDPATWVQQSALSWCKANQSGRNITFLDARTQFGAVLDFIKQDRSQQVIKVQGEAVVFYTGHARIGGESVTTATVRDIVSNLIPA